MLRLSGGWLIAIGIAVAVIAAGAFLIWWGAKANSPHYDLRTVTTSDGHTILCLEYHEGGGQSSVGSLTCDFTTLREATP